ncbi:unnamed protein product [Schistosoma turkestanicum]|nr:unnamed protein product [Schistosoma turkestanicum]
MIRPLFAVVSKNSFWTLSVAHTSKKALQRQRKRDSVVYDVHSKDALNSKQVYVFGFSATGALGNEKYLGLHGKPGRAGVSHPVPLKCSSSMGVPLKAACGYGFTTYICEGNYGDFGVYGCGINSDGQLGSQSVGLKTELASGNSVNVIPEPVRIDVRLDNTQKKIYRPSHVACGRAHTIISYENLKEPNNDTPPLIFSLGNNVFGQCGREIIPGEKYDHDLEVITKIVLPPEIKSIKQLVCGQDHTLLLSSDGIVYTCGLGSDGQTGLGHYNVVDRFTAIKGSLINERVRLLSSRGDTVLALTESNKLFAWGNNEYGQIWSLDQNVQVSEPIHLNLDHCIVPSESHLSPDNVHVGEIQSIACAGSMCCIVNKIGQVNLVILQFN